MRMIPRRNSAHLDPPVGKRVKAQNAEEASLRIERPGQLCAMMAVDGLGTLAPAVSWGSRNHSAGSKPAEVSVRCNVPGVGNQGRERGISQPRCPSVAVNATSSQLQYRCSWAGQEREGDSCVKFLFLSPGWLGDGDWQCNRCFSW